MHRLHGLLNLLCGVVRGSVVLGVCVCVVFGGGDDVVGPTSLGTILGGCCCHNLLWGWIITVDVLSWCPKISPLHMNVLPSQRQSYFLLLSLFLVLLLWLSLLLLILSCIPLFVCARHLHVSTCAAPLVVDIAVVLPEGILPTFADGLPRHTLVPRWHHVRQRAHAAFHDHLEGPLSAADLEDVMDRHLHG